MYYFFWNDYRIRLAHSDMIEVPAVLVMFFDSYVILCRVIP